MAHEHSSDDQPLLPHLRLDVYGRNLGTAALFVGIAGVLVSTTSLLFTIYVSRQQLRVQASVGRMQTDVSKVQASVGAVQTTVQSLVPPKALSISPAGSGGNVGATETVRGTTPFADRNIYVIVVPAINGVAWVQDGPATKGPGGEGIGTARSG